MLTRWAAPDYERAPARRISAIRVPFITDDLPDIPSAKVLYQSQQKFPPSESVKKTLTILRELYGDRGEQVTFDLWGDQNGKIYVPPEDEALQLRIAVAAHCGFGGHRGYSTTCE
eukprot:IDg12092t1